MAGRPKIFDLDNAIRKATEVFWKKGYEASSTEELLAAMGIGKGSFYLHFKEGKKELYQRSLNLFSDDAMTRFNKKRIEAEDEIQFLKDFLLSAVKSTEEQNQMGCYLGNGIVEMSNLDGKTKNLAGALMNKLENAFTDIITKAQNSGRMKNKTDATLLAKYLINLRNGINVSMRTEKNNKALKQMITMSLEIIE